MLGEHPLNAAIIGRLVITLLDDPGQFAGGERMGHRQPYDMLLNLLRETCIDGRPAAGMREGAPVE
jgi:hypothetical protein